MIPLDYILEVLDNGRFFIIFPLVYCLLLITNKIIFKKFFNGLAFLTFPTAIVFSIVVDQYLGNNLNAYKLLYFCFSDVLLYVFVLLLYRRIINRVNKKVLLGILKRINDKYFLLFVFIIFIEILINLLNVKWDGSSRIEFQTNRWFSFVRFFSQLINPVIGLLIFYNGYEKNYKKITILTLIVVIFFISSGSKSSFVFFLIEYFLIYKDIIYIKNKISLKVSTTLIIFISLAAIFNFFILSVDYQKIFERIMDYGESTIMVFPSPDPCAACRGQSMISLIHRGLGRLIGDPSSVDIDKLFGYSLATEFYGKNTFTGPNARIGSYAICAFPGSQIAILYAIFIVFLFFNYALLKITNKGAGFFYISALLLLFNGIEQFVLDYNAAMSDLTAIVLMMIFLLVRFAFKLNIFDKERTLTQYN